ncbi:MAG: amidohydrolase family protein [Acidobacteria bacterium]|nr:amidohydrolase family protein [Acidobacteriota bacterium]
MRDAAALMLSLGFSRSEVARMTSGNPSRLLGLSDRGSIEVGQRADIIGLDGSGDIQYVMIGGQRVR